ncbi:MAG: hypothetical protein AW10_02389 [Candidatus Accumulibacter appositus]|uniref:Uncharacterized protein n=1 Tax=Candidatus Accumulibacter appositus TaxID=1454003 RepID=A0A011QKK5_9PROT|nr:MAG: hypothetical protein AW10_02389 [Candidatus Accumulibacter appositus]
MGQGVEQRFAQRDGRIRAVFEVIEPVFDGADRVVGVDARFDHSQRERQRQGIFVATVGAVVVGGGALHAFVRPAKVRQVTANGFCLTGNQQARPGELAIAQHPHGAQQVEVTLAQQVSRRLLLSCLVAQALHRGGRNQRLGRLGDDRRGEVGIAPFDHQFFAQVAGQRYAGVAFAHRSRAGRVGVGRQATVHLHDQ